MNVDELRYFVEAARARNLTHAARALGITPSTLSHAIRRLETEFGRPLFSKEGKQVFLTQHGKRFAERAAELVAGIQTLRNEMTSEAAPVLGHFRVGTTPGPAARLFARAWNRAGLSRESLLEAVGLRSAEVVKRVAARELDLGLCLAPHPHPDLRLHTIAESESVIAVRSGHDLLRRRKGRESLLADFPLAMAKHAPGVSPCSMHPIFRALKLPAGPRYYFDNYDVALEILASSDAWAVLPMAIVTESAGKLAPIPGTAHGSVALVLATHHEDEHQLVLRALGDPLRAAAEALGWRPTAESFSEGLV